MIEKLRIQIESFLNKMTSLWIGKQVSHDDIFKFYERALYLETLGSNIEFANVARWISMITKSPVIAVYKRQGEEILTQMDKFLIQQNISGVAHSVDPTLDLKDKKNLQTIIKRVEEQFTNLQQHIDWSSEFNRAGEITLTIGKCQYFPLAAKDKIWGILVLGPYVNLPEFFIKKFPLLSEVITGWLLKIEEKDITLKKYKEQNVLREIRKIGSLVINLNQIFSFLLSYIVKATSTSFALLAEVRGDETLPIYGINMKPEWTNLFVGSLDDIPLIIDHELGVIYEEDSSRILEAGIYSDFIFPIPYGNKFAFLVIGTDKQDYSIPHHSIKVIQELCNVLSNILLARESNSERIQNLLDIYYSMLRIYEFMNDKTQYHTPRVIAFAKLFAKHLQYNYFQEDILLQAARYHDVGYVIALEMKDAMAIDSEYEHPLLSKYLLDILPLPLPIKDAVYMHEEWVNGLGYPQGIKGEVITEEAKLISVIERIVEYIEDNEDSQSEETRDNLIEFLRHRAGKQLDEAMVETAAKILSQFSWNELRMMGLKE